MFGMETARKEEEEKYQLVALRVDLSIKHNSHSAKGKTTIYFLCFSAVFLSQTFSFT